MVKPCLGYKTRTAAVLDLQSKGLSNAEIGRKIGIPTTQVSALALSAARYRATNPVDGSIRRIECPAETLEALRPHAARRGLTAGELAGRLIAVIGRDNLVDGVLDDEVEL